MSRILNGFRQRRVNARQALYVAMLVALAVCAWVHGKAPPNSFASYVSVLCAFGIGWVALSLLGPGEH